MLTLESILKTTRQLTAYGEAGHSHAKGTISLADVAVKQPARPGTEKASEAPEAPTPERPADSKYGNIWNAEFKDYLGI